jgi:hypothetical protein
MHASQAVVASRTSGVMVGLSGEKTGCDGPQLALDR